KRTVRRQRLDIEYIETGAGKAPCCEVGDQRHLVHNGPAREIDQEGVRPQRIHHLAADQTARFRGIGSQNDEKIRFSRRSNEVAPWTNLIKALPCPPGITDADYAHAETPAALREFLADRADADQDHRLAKQETLRPALPALAMLVADHARQVARQRQ